jgi:hypothetical protein
MGGAATDRAAEAWESVSGIGAEGLAKELAPRVGDGNEFGGGRALV